MGSVKKVWAEFQDAIKENGRTQNWVADQIMVSNISLSKILNGERPMTEKNLKRLNELLGTSIGENNESGEAERSTANNSVPR